ncbi:MAG: Clp protease ClpP [Alistipes sp.]|jgi:ATP-dependent protease ClpP protease subunit|nr:Clp protease ClpP [Alistipes sp.]
MREQIQIKNEVDCSVIDIEGTIGVDESWQFDNPESRVATYERFKECVARIADIRDSEIRVNIRSTGGDVNDAILIYEALRATGAKVVTCCYGYTASAATIVAQAASEGCRLVAPSSLYLIHNSICATEGNAEELMAEVEMLQQTDRRLAEIYATRSGRSVDDIALLMSDNGGRGRWLSPAEAIAEGLVDGVIEESVVSPSTSLVERTKRGVMALLRSLGFDNEGDGAMEGDADMPIVDVNHSSRMEQPEVKAYKSVGMSSRLLVEKQRSAEATKVRSIHDPEPIDVKYSSREIAYEEDARNMRMR